MDPGPVQLPRPPLTLAAARPVNMKFTLFLFALVLTVVSAAGNVSSNSVCFCSTTIHHRR